MKRNRTTKTSRATITVDVWPRTESQVVDNLVNAEARPHALIFPKQCAKTRTGLLERTLCSRSKLLTIAILGAWLIVVIFVTTRHEFWRDEVRALSLARAANSPLDLYGLTQYDGHPILWFLLLYIGKSIVDTPLVLPVISIVIAFIAVAVFMFSAPFPFWIRTLFIFSGLPFYEFSVMARNYGISMLLFFVSAIVYRNREKHPLFLASVLALLANTNGHSAILVCLIMAVWIWELVAEQKTESFRFRGRLYLSFAIVFGGVLLCVIFTMPRANTNLTSIYSVSARDVADSISSAILRPDQTFAEIVPRMFSPLVAGLLIYLAVFGLLHRRNLFLAALSALFAFGVFFRVVYYGGYRHQGLFLIFLLFLYWLYIESSSSETLIRKKRLLFNAGLYVAILTIVSWNVVKGAKFMWDDVTMERSSSQALGEFLNNSRIYLDAILVPEPDTFLEAVPYYAKNEIYFPREQRFGTTVSWTSDSNYRLSLGELLRIARDLRKDYGRSVLIVLGHGDFYGERDGDKERAQQLFTWTTDEFAEFSRSTDVVAYFNSAYTDENYRVYAVR